MLSYFGSTLFINKSEEISLCFSNFKLNVGDYEKWLFPWEHLVYGSMWDFRTLRCACVCVCVCMYA